MKWCLTVSVALLLTMAYSTVLAEELPENSRRSGIQDFTVALPRLTLRVAARDTENIVNAEFYDAAVQLQGFLIQDRPLISQRFETRFSRLESGIDHIETVIGDATIEDLPHGEQLEFINFLDAFQNDTHDFADTLRTLKSGADPGTEFADLIDEVDNGVSDILSVIEDLQSEVNSAAEAFLSREFENAVRDLPGQLEAAGFTDAANDFQTAIDELLDRVGSASSSIEGINTLTPDQRVALVNELEILNNDLGAFEDALLAAEEEFRNTPDLRDTFSNTAGIVAEGIGEIGLGLMDFLGQRIATDARNFFAAFDNAVGQLPQQLEDAGFPIEAAQFGPTIDDLLGRVNRIDATFDNGLDDFSAPQLMNFIDEVDRLRVDLADFEIALQEKQDQFGEAFPPEVNDGITIISDGLVHIGHSLTQEFQPIRDLFGTMGDRFSDMEHDNTNDLLERITTFEDEMEKMRESIGHIFPGQEDDILEELARDTAAAREIIRFVNQAYAAFEHLDTEESRGHTANYLSTVRKRAGEQRRRPATAGDWASNLELSMTYSNASFDNRAAGGSGHDQSSDVFISGLLGDNVQFGLGVTHTRYEIGGSLQLERNSRVYEMYMNYLMTDAFSVGLFINESNIDIEERVMFNPLLGRNESLFGDSYDRWGAGLLASYSMALGHSDLGVTTSLSSTNKRSLQHILDNEDSAWATLVDLRIPCTDTLATTLYGTYYALIDNERFPINDSQNREKLDGSFWMIGADIELTPSDRYSISLGYETTLAYHDYHENRVRFSFSYYW